MLLIIHNLPTHIEYNDIKDLIISKCGLKDAILDNLQHEGSGMRVTVGVVEEEDAALLVRKMNGIYYRGQQLYVEDKRQKKDTEQPYRTLRPQQPQYSNMMGYNYNTPVQAPTPGMYTQSANYGGYPSQATLQTDANAFMPFGGQQQQPILYSNLGTFNDFNQQKVQSPNLYARQSPSDDRHAQGAGRREEVRGTRGDPQRRPAPADPAPWATEPLRQTNYQDFNTQRNERSGQSRGFDQDVYEERGSRQNDKRGYNAHDSYGGHSSNQRDIGGGHSSNQRDMRGDNSSNQRDMRGGHSYNQRDMRGGHSANQLDMSGGYSSNQRDMRGGHSSNQRGMRGGHTSNMRGGHTSNMRGGHTSNQRDMSDGHSSSAYDVRGGHSSNMRGGHASNMRGGHTSNLRGSPNSNKRGGQNSNMRGGHTSNNRGGHISNMRGGHFLNNRGGHNSNMRGGHAPSSRDNARDTQYDNQKFAKKRRWDDQSEQPESSPARHDDHEPQAKKPAPGPGQSSSFWKEHKQCKFRGVGKLMFHISTNLNIKMTEGPNAVKSALRKVLTPRVAELMGEELLVPDEIYARYRALYPETEDIVVYNDILKQVAEGKQAKAVNPVYQENPAPKANKVNAAPPPLRPVTQFKQKKKALKKSMRPVSPGKIPSYPEGNKKIHSQQKQKIKEELATLQPCQVSANIQKAMEEEAELIGAILEKAFKCPESNIEKSVYERVDQEHVIDRCKKLICYHISRRITKSGVKMVRIYGIPHPPRRPVLEKYLAQFGCLALKKSVKAPFYTATFDSYDTIDMLCAMDSVPVGDQNIFITFKQMLMAPQKEKLDQKRAKHLRQLETESLIEDSKVNLLDKDWQAVEEDEKNKAEKKKEMEVNDNPTTAKTETNEDEEMFVQQEIADIAADATDFTEDNHDFLNVDFQVIDEVKGSDNDDAANDGKKREHNDGNNSKDDWDLTEGDWDEDGENQGGNDDNKDNEGSADKYDHEGNIDENDDENKDKDNVNNDNVVGGYSENENQDENNENAGDDENENDENEAQNMGNVNIEDVDLDDVNEDDLEDY